MEWDSPWRHWRVKNRIFDMKVDTVMKKKLPRRQWKDTIMKIMRIEEKCEKYKANFVISKFQFIIKPKGGIWKVGKEPVIPFIISHYILTITTWQTFLYLMSSTRFQNMVNLTYLHKDLPMNDLNTIIHEKRLETT